MAKKKKSMMGWIIGILIILVLFTTTLSVQEFSVINEAVWLPQYWTGECVERADNMAQLEERGHDDDPTFYHCTTNEAGKWIPIVNGVQCEYKVEMSLGSLSIYKCKGITDNKEDLKDSNKCTKVVGFTSDSGAWTQSINAGDTIYINTNQLIGDAKLLVKYPSFGIRARTADGFVTPTSTSCIANDINKVISGQVHTLDRNNRLEIIPDVPLNVVTGLKQGISSQHVSLPDVENGKEIYITRPNYYYRISTAEDNFKYVDTIQGEFSSTKIECIPRTTGCSDDAKIVKLEEQSCDKYGGAITNYAPVQGDSTKLCKYSCTSGKLFKTNDCITVQSDCPDDKPLWDAKTGDCITIQQETSDDEQDLFYVYLGMSVLGVLLLIFIIKMAIDKKKVR